jgi:hypothetical protein
MATANWSCHNNVLISLCYSYKVTWHFAFMTVHYWIPWKCDTSLFTSILKLYVVFFIFTKRLVFDFFALYFHHPVSAFRPYSPTVRSFWLLICVQRFRFYFSWFTFRHRLYVALYYPLGALLSWKNNVNINFILLDSTVCQNCNSKRRQYYTHIW